MTGKADTRLRRLPEQGSKDFNLACAIIDDARICHVGFVLDGQPYVVPMAHARDGDELLLHGSVASRLAKNLAAGLPCCVTITHLDGLVLARSAFHSSMNYRSVMVFGSAAPVTDPDKKVRGLDVLTEHLLPGRLAELRASTRKELNATTLLSLPIERFSVKTRKGPPDDPKNETQVPIWAGVIPLSLRAGKPEAAPDMPAGIARPRYLKSM
ncbi:MAG: pyridoxamine 5'-phosphate oxidase family protein [Xanthomonadales bacterium]|jgi:nitroimidazol reductase NimA-like FMN-containing flavoprotein (pyridoxamine 5'-phosphate oxidase superfamily)|nr:pyridoxamine 5'-phosphate oxidase family protein [Xanthomonadales bacterium]